MSHPVALASSHERQEAPTTYRLADLTRDNAAEHGDRPALTLDDTTVSHAELDERATRVAAALAASGVGEGDRVAIWDLNGLEFFDLLFGAAKVGAVLCPANFRFAPPEVARLVDDARASLLVVGAPFVEALDSVELGDATSTVVLLADVADGDRVTWTDWLAGHDEATDPGFTGGDDTVVLQLYTSGTTGRPKGVQLVNRNLGALAATVTDEWGIDSESRALVAMPLFHIGGSGWALVPLNVGGHGIVVRELEPASLLDTMEEQRITDAFLVPAVLQMLCQVPGVEQRDWSHLQSIAYGASPITSTTLTTVLETFRAPMFQVYGMTETAGAVVQLPPEDHDPGGPREHLLRSAGKPYDEVDVRVVAPDGTSEQPAGETGEIWLRSPSNMVGYWNQPEETERTLTDDGWIRTGDAGHLDDEGYLYVTDRIKDMIISGGENIYPIEVEQALASHPAVADVAVIGVPDDRWGETVKAVVVASDDVTEQELIDHCGERIARFKRPTSVDFTDELPRNATGKLLKTELRAPYWEGHDRNVS